MRPSGSVESAAFTPDGERVITASADGSARIWDADSGAELETLRYGDSVGSVAFSPDGELVVTAGGTDLARIWDAATAPSMRPAREWRQVRLRAPPSAPTASWS